MRALRAGGAAQEAGVRREDFVVAIDGTDTRAMDKAAALDALKAAGASVVLTLARPTATPSALGVDGPQRSRSSLHGRRAKSHAAVTGSLGDPRARGQVGSSPNVSTLVRTRSRKKPAPPTSASAIAGASSEAEAAAPPTTHDRTPAADSVTPAECVTDFEEPDVMAVASVQSDAAVASGDATATVAEQTMSHATHMDVRPALSTADDVGVDIGHLSGTEIDIDIGIDSSFDIGSPPPPVPLSSPPNDDDDAAVPDRTPDADTVPSDDGIALLAQTIARTIEGATATDTVVDDSPENFADAPSGMVEASLDDGAPHAPVPKAEPTETHMDTAAPSLASNSAVPHTTPTAATRDMYCTTLLSQTNAALK